MRPDAMRPRSRPKPERVRPRPNDLASRPRGPRGLNIPVEGGLLSKSDERENEGRRDGISRKGMGRGYSTYLLDRGKWNKHWRVTN